MGRLLLAFKMFFRILKDPDIARRLEVQDSASSTQLVATPPQEKPTPKVKPLGRSDALTLLETLQREARLIDFLQEDLSAYDDSQVGAAVREVHRDSRSVLDRCFQIESVLANTEGESFEVTSEVDPAEVRLTGHVSAERPVTGTLVHSGWKAIQCKLPQWTGKDSHQLILAPAEVEVGR